MNEALLRLADRIVVEMADQSLGRLPCFIIGFAHDEVQTNAEAHLAAAFAGSFAHLGDLLGNLCRRLAPGQVLVDTADGEIDAGIRRAAEIERRARVLHRGKAEARIGRLDVFAVEACRSLFQQFLEDGEELFGMGIALVMLEMDAIAG